MACRDEPITCRRKIASLLGLAEDKRRSWQFVGRCPACGHGGFSITAGNQGRYPLRHVWHCNCHRDRCDPGLVRAAMVQAGVSEECLGSYGRRPRGQVADPDVAEVRAAMEAVLADPKIRALSDLKLRVAEVVWGEAPSDWPGFLVFAERAGVPRSKRYAAAARWGRRNRVVPRNES